LSTEALPEPDPESLAVSDALVATIRDEIEANGGWLGFERFMELALYAPGLGYYSAGSLKFGPGGDFTTAPEQGDWLAMALAPFIAEALEAVESSRLLELGAGSGKLAAALVAQLAGLRHDDIDYAIFETSADLRQRQQALLGSRRIAARWLERMPETPFCGVVLANEVADALPVMRFVKSQGAIRPLGVTASGGVLRIEPGAEDPDLTAAVEAIEAELGAPLPDGYTSEICRLLEPWLDDLLGVVDAGGILLIDYGMSRRDYYRPERSGGTFICHYRQRAHADPLLWPGLQDLTAWVDFSAVANCARRAGFSLSGFTTQAQFLLESLTRHPALAGTLESPVEASRLKTLMLPGEMGERFKLIWLSRGFAAEPLPGRDFRSWL